MELPYVGSDVLASALAMSKPTSKVMFRDAGLPVARSVVVVRGDAVATAELVVRELGDRVVVKPGASGSAIGVEVLPKDIAQALAAAWSLDDVALVEMFAEGREVTCGIMDLHGEDARALPPTEVRSPKDAFYTYEARYAPGRSEHVCPADIGPDLVARVQAVALAAHRALGCRDLSRVDFVVGAEVTLLEVNTLPGFTDTSLYPEAAAVMGIPMPDLCKRLVESAKRRGTKRRNAAKPLPT
jgi:D-alanine-D-alanine ligase